MVRNGYVPERALQTGLGPATVQIPKVRAKTGEAVTFRSARVLPYIRKIKSMKAAVLWSYLKRISSGKMRDALNVRVGPQAQGLSASTVSRLKQVWAEEYRFSVNVPPSLPGPPIPRSEHRASYAASDESGFE